jgi:hypothetical protein
MLNGSDNRRERSRICGPALTKLRREGGVSRDRRQKETLFRQTAVIHEWRRYVAACRWALCSRYRGLPAANNGQTI